MANQKTVRILSFDGGGIRGIIPATLIQYAEEYLQQKQPGTSIADHFDLIAGTSTGGILTCIYLTPENKNDEKARYTAQEALDFYVKEGYNIFNASKLSNWKRFWGIRNATQFNPEHIEELFKEKFGDCLLSELLKPCLITTYDMISKTAFFFTSMENLQHREFYVRDVARSTSAAPTYFPPAEINNLAPKPREKKDPLKMINIDGGVFAGNPLMCAYTEARKTNFEARKINQPAANQMYILSLGTGGGGFVLPETSKSAKWSLLDWGKSVPEIMMDGSIDTVSYQMNQIYGTVQSNDPGRYLRIDVPIEFRHYADNLADASLENIEKLQLAADKTLVYAKNKGLNSFLDGLLD